MVDWDLSFLTSHWSFLLQGLLGTAWLVAVCLVIGSALGLAVACLRLAPVSLLRALGTAYVELFRNIPSLVQIFWWYFTLPVLTGLQPDPFAAATAGISLYSAAYFAEIFRSGIQSIEHGQWDAARATGMGDAIVFRDIVLPQAFRRILPALTNQVIETVKTTTIASTIAYGELLYSAKMLSDQEFKPLQSFTSLGVFFVVVLSLFGLGTNWLERHFKNSGSA